MRASALISPAELADLLGQTDTPFTVLDASYGIGLSGLPPQQAFSQIRLPGAQFFDIDAVADQDSDLPHMLPSPEGFASAAGALGISNNHEVIVYDQTGIVMAACRAWWMFRAFGHDRVRVLDGGMPAWVAAGQPLESGSPSEPEAQTFTARFQPQLVTSYAQMKDRVETGDSVILDARPPERFAGLSAEPRPGLNAGHMPGAHSLPAGSLIDPATRTMKHIAEIRDRVKALAPSHDSRIVTTCGSGVTACVIALALHDIGYENISVYDGSWSEWAREELNSPIVKGFE